MEHRGLEYTLQQRGERHEWTWTIFPKDRDPRAGHVAGTRGHAELAAIRAIDNLLRENESKR